MTTEILSGDVLPERPSGPLVIIPGTPDLRPITVEGAELRIVDGGRIHRWNATRGGFDLIGIEVKWVAQRLEQLEIEAQALRKMVGAPDLVALVQKRLADDLVTAATTEEQLRSALALAERQRDDFRLQLRETMEAVRTQNAMRVEEKGTANASSDLCARCKHRRGHHNVGLGFGAKCIHRLTDEEPGGECECAGFL